MLQIISYFLQALIAVIANLSSLTSQKQILVVVAVKNFSYPLLSIQPQRAVPQDLAELPLKQTIGMSISRNHRCMRLLQRAPLHISRTRRRVANPQILIHPAGDKMDPVMLMHPRFLRGAVNKMSPHQEALGMTMTAATALSCRMPLGAGDLDLNAALGPIF